MAGAKRGEVNTSFDIEQLLVEAQHRWLRPAEICELLQNYKKFRIAPEPPNKPPSGSLFLFDRKVSRYFRKDGHNWRKKKDGKTVKEAHERLKVGSVDMLHCYYAHGEENEKFQRRSYWMLEEDLMHIVLVHYREVKDKPSFSRTTSLSRAREVEEVKQVTQMCKVSTPNSTMSQSQPHSQTMGTDSPVSSHTSEYEDAESGAAALATRIICYASPESIRIIKFMLQHSACIAGYPKQTLMQRIIIKQLPDTTLSLRCGGMMIDE